MSGTSALILIALGGGALALLIVVAVLGIAAYSAHSVVRPRRDWQPVDWSPPRPAPENVSFLNEQGQRLQGWYVAPLPGHPVALICHGFGTNRREGQDLLPWLASEGYGALLFDFQAHGESDGHYTTVGMREIGDVLTAVRYIQERVVPPAPIVALGFSMGASVLIMAAARAPAIRAFVLDSPFATLHRAVSRSFAVFFHLPPRVFTRPTIWFAERFTGGRIGEVQPVLEISSASPRPILIVQGTEDAIVHPQDSQLLYDAAGEPKSLWRIEGAGHVQARSVFPVEYRRRMFQTFEAAVGPVPVPAPSEALAV